MGTRPVKPEGGYWMLGDRHPAASGTFSEDLGCVIPMPPKRSQQGRLWSYRTAQQHPVGTERTYIAAEWDGQPKRPPKKGEWYLGPDCAYKAPNDFDSPYYIARIVKLRVSLKINIVNEGAV